MRVYADGGPERPCQAVGVSANMYMRAIPWMRNTTHPPPARGPVRVARWNVQAVEGQPQASAGAGQ
jgi:hypothetical protein